MAKINPMSKEEKDRYFALKKAKPFRVVDVVRMTPEDIRTLVQLHKQLGKKAA